MSTFFKHPGDLRDGSGQVVDVLQRHECHDQIRASGTQGNGGGVPDHCHQRWEWVEAARASAGEPSNATTR
jgi:hypothetical protein